ncbi:MAG: amino acid adenylation domain-containing protein, partial [Acidobacteria bacterium]|nr:amino acid adenylation domain-containing protein [Acidobacteriota bacterium]
MTNFAFQTVFHLDPVASSYLILMLEYDTGRFADEQIEAIAGYFVETLNAMASHPSERIDSRCLLSTNEQNKLITEWNNAISIYQNDVGIHHLFESQVEKTPNAIALVFEGSRLTYHELNNRANRLSGYLQSLGVEPDMTVGICLERSPEVVIAILGILKAGAAYVPLEFRQPKDRLSNMIEDAKISILLSQQTLIEGLPENRLRLICLDTEWEIIAQHTSTRHAGIAGSENLAYVLFTSGSTGRPKGVGVEHRQLLNYVNAIKERLQFPIQARAALVSTFAADLGNTVLFPTLCTGGELHIISQELGSDAKALSDYFNTNRIDCLKIVPSYLEAVCERDGDEHILPDKLLVLGGEATRREWVEQLQRKVPLCRVFNHYGPTETTVGVLSYNFDGLKHAGLLTLPLGQPLPNLRVYILDKFVQLAPIGTTGEIHIAGRGLTRGYLNHPEMTCEKFIPNPFGEEPGSRLYQTGDLARYLPDAYIEFLGRSDSQVKIRGFRVELGEIESVLNRHAAVEKAVVHGAGACAPAARASGRDDRPRPRRDARAGRRRRDDERHTPGKHHRPSERNQPGARRKV